MKVAVIGCTHAGTSAIVNTAKLYRKHRSPFMNAMITSHSCLAASRFTLEAL